MWWSQAELVKNEDCIEEAPPVGVAEVRVARGGQSEKVLDGGLGASEGGEERGLKGRGEGDGLGRMVTIE